MTYATIPNSWADIAQAMIDRVNRDMKTRDRQVNRVRFSLESVMQMRGINYVPCDARWRELENALRSSGYLLVRPDDVSLAIMDMRTFDSWTKIGLNDEPESVGEAE